MITQAQRWRFFPLVTAAWQQHLAESGQPDNSEQKDAWYRDEMEKACREAGLGDGIRSVKTLDPVDGFDAVMLHFAIIAQDDRQISYFSVARERRYRKVIKDLLNELSDLEFQAYTWDYAKAIFNHMRLPSCLEDCPADLMQKVIQALDTQRRRILASRGELSTKKPGLGTNRWNREHHYRVAK